MAKKPKKPTIRTHPRGMFVEVKALKSGTATEMRFNSVTGEVQLLDAAGQVIAMQTQGVGVAAFKEGGKRMQRLARVPFAREVPALRLDLALDAFDTVVATDATPVPGDDGRWVIAGVQLLIERNETAVTWKIVPARVFELAGVIGSAERIGWRLIANEVTGAIDYKEDERVLILTDADLGDHAAINERCREVFPGWSLPQGFALGYGKDQSPSDSVMQFAVRRCDRWGRGIAARLSGTPTERHEVAPAWMQCQSFVCLYNANVDGPPTGLTEWNTGA